VSGTSTDHFSTLAEEYARSRPRYPAALYDWLAERAPAREVAWDCATGNGQAAVDLAGRFARVEATDISTTQLERATPHPRVRYRLAPAEASGLADASVDLVTVAQAAHWLDLQRFFAEVRRVARPGGLVALWGYQLLESGSAALDRELVRFFGEIVGPYWPPGREILDEGFRTIAVPFAELAPPRFEMKVEWNLAQLSGFLASWSAVDRYRRALAKDPVPPFVAEIAPLWGDPAATRAIRWPMALRVARVGGAP
jgi:SAM-dependent methyltransferase